MTLEAGKIKAKAESGCRWEDGWCYIVSAKRRIGGRVAVAGDVLS